MHAGISSPPDSPRDESVSSLNPSSAQLAPSALRVRGRLNMLLLPTAAPTFGPSRRAQGERRQQVGGSALLSRGTGPWEAFARRGGVGGGAAHGGQNHTDDPNPPHRTAETYVAHPPNSKIPLQQKRRKSRGRNQRGLCTDVEVQSQECWNRKAAPAPPQPGCPPDLGHPGCVFSAAASLGDCSCWELCPRVTLR